MAVMILKKNLCEVTVFGSEFSILFTVCSPKALLLYELYECKMNIVAR